MERFDRNWMERYRSIVNSDPTLKVIGRLCDVVFMVSFGDRSYTLHFAEGELKSAIPSEDLLFDANWSFAIRGPVESWDLYLHEPPPPSYTDVIFMSFNERVVLEGNLLPFWQSIRALLWMFDLMRRVEVAAAA